MLLGENSLPHHGHIGFLGIEVRLQWRGLACGMALGVRIAGVCEVHVIRYRVYKDIIDIILLILAQLIQITSARRQCSPLRDRQ